MYSPTTRLLTILERLQSRPTVSGPDLAAELEVDIRSIRRYMTMLRDLGIPIEGSAGRGGSYSMKPGFRLPPLMFTQPEIVAIMLGMVAVRTLGLTDVPGIDSALSKLDRVLPESLQTQARAIQCALSFNINSHRPGIVTALLASISLASYEQKQVWMEYAGTKGSPTQRTFDPYGVIFHGGSWYAVGMCHLRKDRRTFRLDRVIHHRVLDTCFEWPDGFEPVDFLMKSLSRTPGCHSAEVLIYGALEDVRSEIPAHLGRLIECGGHVHWECQCTDLEWMARYVVSLQFSVRVVGPPELKSALRELAGSIAVMIEPEAAFAKVGA